MIVQDPTTWPAPLRAWAEAAAQAGHAVRAGEAGWEADDFAPLALADGEVVLALHTRRLLVLGDHEGAPHRPKTLVYREGVAAASVTFSPTGRIRNYALRGATGTKPRTLVKSGLRAVDLTMDELEMLVRAERAARALAVLFLRALAAGQSARPEILVSPAKAAALPPPPLIALTAKPTSSPRSAICSCGGAIAWGRGRELVTAEEADQTIRLGTAIGECSDCLKQYTGVLVCVGTVSLQGASLPLFQADAPSPSHFDVDLPPGRAMSVGGHRLLSWGMARVPLRRGLADVHFLAPLAIPHGDWRTREDVAHAIAQGLTPGARDLLATVNTEKEEDAPRGLGGFLAGWLGGRRGQEQ